MALVHARVANFVIVVVKDRDLVRLLEYLDADVILENVRHWLWPTLVARCRRRRPAQLDLTEPLHGLGRLRLQYRTCVIADHFVGVAYAPLRSFQQAGLVGHRPRPRRRRLEAGHGGVAPDSGEIRDRCSAWRKGRTWPNRERRILTQGGRWAGCRQNHQPKEVQRHAHRHLLPASRDMVRIAALWAKVHVLGLRAGECADAEQRAAER